MYISFSIKKWKEYKANHLFIYWQKNDMVIIKQRRSFPSWCLKTWLCGRIKWGKIGCGISPKCSQVSVLRTGDNVACLHISRRSQLPLKFLDSVTAFILCWLRIYIFKKMELCINQNSVFIYFRNISRHIKRKLKTRDLFRF